MWLPGTTVPGFRMPQLLRLEQMLNGQLFCSSALLPIANQTST